MGQRRKSNKIQDAFVKPKALQQVHGFVLVVMIWPVMVPFEDYAYTAIHSWVAEEARDRCNGPARGFRRGGEHDSYYLSPNDHFHPNAKRQGVAATAFRKWLEARKKNETRVLFLRPAVPLPSRRRFPIECLLGAGFPPGAICYARRLPRDMLIRE